MKIGIIGMDTPMTAEFAKGTDRIKGLNFTDPVQAVKQVIRQIDGQVDAIVLVAHMGIDTRTSAPAPAWRTSPTPTRSWRRSSPATCM